MYNITIPFQITIHSPLIKETNKRKNQIKSKGNYICIINQLLLMYLKIIRKAYLYNHTDNKKVLSITK